MSTLISPSSPAWRSRPLVTAKFLASISAAAGITSFWVKSIAVLAICRCSSVRSSGVNTSCGSRSSVRKLPPLTRFAIICMLLVAICISSVQILEDSRGPHAASHAHRHNSILGAPTYHLLKQSGLLAIDKEGTENLFRSNLNRTVHPRHTRRGCTVRFCLPTGRPAPLSKVDQLAQLGSVQRELIFATEAGIHATGARME